VQWLYRMEEVYGYVLEGYWTDIGNIESYEKAKKIFA